MHFATILQAVQLMTSFPNNAVLNIGRLMTNCSYLKMFNFLHSPLFSYYFLYVDQYVSQLVNIFYV